MFLRDVGGAIRTIVFINSQGRQKSRCVLSTVRPIRGAPPLAPAAPFARRTFQRTPQHFVTDQSGQRWPDQNCWNSMHFW